MIDADGSYNLFENLKINSLVELMFLATLPEYKQRGIGMGLCKASIDLTKCLFNGENVKVSITDEPLELEPRPQAVSAIYTSFISQKIGAKLGFVEAISISYEKFKYKGNTFASKIGPSTPNTSLQYLLL